MLPNAERYFDQESEFLRRNSYNFESTLRELRRVLAFIEKQRLRNIYEPRFYSKVQIKQNRPINSQTVPAVQLPTL